MPKYYGCPCEGCGEPLTLKDDIVVCPDCGAPYHRTCYEKLGRCIHSPAHAAGDEWHFPYQDAELRTCPSCGERTLRSEETCRCCGAALPPETEADEQLNDRKAAQDEQHDGFDYERFYRQYEQQTMDPLHRNLQAAFGKDELIDGAILYMRIYAFGLPAMALYNFGSAVLTASGDTKRPLIFLSIAGGLNICLNLFFVIVCKMAADGVALATILSQYTSAVLVLRVLLRTQEDYRLELKNFVFSWEKAQRILALGITSGLQHAIFAMANLFIQSAVNTFSAAVVEGNSAAANADSLVYEVMAAPYTACSTFISQNYGAHNKERIQEAYRVSLVYSFGVGAVLGLALMFFGGGFLRIFTPDPEVIAAGMEKLHIMGWSYAFSAFMDNSLAASRGLGKSAVPVAIVILGSCVFRVIWVYTIFAMFHTLTSLYLLYIFSWALTAIGQMVYFFRAFRKQTAAWKTPQLA